MTNENTDLSRASGWWKKKVAELPGIFDYSYISKEFRFTVTSVCYKYNNRPIRISILFGVYDDISDGVVEYKYSTNFKNYYEFLGNKLNWGIDPKNFGTWEASSRSEVPQSWWDAVRSNANISPDIFNKVMSEM